MSLSAVRHYDVYIQTTSESGHIIRTVQAADPDAAMHAVTTAGDLILDAGDRVTRCVMVNDRPPYQSKNRWAA